MDKLAVINLDYEESALIFNIRKTNSECHKSVREMRGTAMINIFKHIVIWE